MSRRDKVDIVIIILIMLGYGYYNYSHGYSMAIQDIKIAVEKERLAITGDTLHIVISKTK